MIAESDKNKENGFFLKPFTLLDDFKSKLFLVVFCGVFSAFFILLYNPFNLQAVTYDTAMGRLLSIWNAGILGAIILTITQFFLRPFFKLKTFTVGQFLGWLILEFTLLCLGILIVFGESKEPLLKELSGIAKYTISLGILPYMIACLLIAVFKLSNKEKETEEYSAANPEPLSIKDENGKVMLVVNPKQILFLKSEDNYTSIFHEQNGKVEKKLIRTNLKKLESELEYPDLIRIHRSYMVNLQSVVSVHRKKGDFQIQLKHLPDLFLKVSETYKNLFEARIKK